jgi:hypothetical protein
MKCRYQKQNFTISSAMDGFMTKCRSLIGELYMWSTSWKIIKPIVNTTYYSNERVRSKKLIYKFSYEENLDVDAIFLNQLWLPTTIAIPKNNHNEKINDWTKKENEPRNTKSIEDANTLWKMQFNEKNENATRREQWKMKATGNECAVRNKSAMWSSRA